ncbi:MAG: hypothetical protein ACKODM_13675, partial [Cytophagales bacterium]
INGEVDAAHVKLFDATTITLFVDVFKGVGRNPLNGKRKGGLKVQAQMFYVSIFLNTKTLFKLLDLSFPANCKREFNSTHSTTRQTKQFY